MRLLAFLLDKGRAWLPLLPLLLLLAATWWLNRQVSPLPPSQVEKRHDVDYVIEKYSAIALNALGQPRHIMSAEKLWHYPDDDTTHLQKPHIVSQSGNSPAVSTSAQTGTISSKGDEVFLYDEVQVVRAAGNGMSEQRFDTDYLHVIPDRDWADSDKPVTMTNQFSTIEATGMELDNRAGTVRLLSHVRAKHDPIRR